MVCSYWKEIIEVVVVPYNSHYVSVRDADDMLFQ